MYVKLYSRILDSSLAENRDLRHFFTDLLLLADLEGNVIITKQKICDRIGAKMEEVEWGLAELMKPDPNSLTPDHEGRRIIPLEGHGYGWKIVNYATYRDYKNSTEMRAATAERVKRYRERKASAQRKKKEGKMFVGSTVRVPQDGMGNGNMDLPDSLPVPALAEKTEPIEAVL